MFAVYSPQLFKNLWKRYRCIISAER